MTKHYTSHIRGLSPRPRSKRLRAQGIGGTLNVSSAGLSSIVGEGHSHANKELLDSLTLDEKGYLSVESVNDDGDAEITPYLPKFVFDDLFEKVELSEGKYAIKAKYDLYSVGDITAMGCNPASAGSGSGGIGADGMYYGDWTDYITDYDTFAVSAKSAKKLYDLINSKAADGQFVKKAGDTMTGKLTISNSGGGNQLTVNNTAGGESYFWLQSNSINKGALTTMQPSYGTCIYDATSSRYLGIKTNGTPHFQGNTLWHAGNDGSGSGLDADLLDGKHNGELTAQILAKSSIIADLNAPTFIVDAITLDRFNSTATNKPIDTDNASSVINISNSTHGTSGHYGAQLAIVNRDRMFFRRWEAGAQKAWKEFAWLDSNVASATKLFDNTAFKAWGQTFFENGKPKTVSGDMSSVGNITSTGWHWVTKNGYAFYWGPDKKYCIGCNTTTDMYLWSELDAALRIGTNNTERIRVLGNGKVGIGTTAPAYKLDVNGTARATSLTIGNATLSWDSANNALKVSTNLYSDGDITALGSQPSSGGSSEGSSGGSYDRLDTWSDYTTEKAGWVLSAKLGNDLYTEVLNFKGGAAVDVLTTGGGNAVTAISKSGTVITATKGANFVPWTKNTAAYANGTNLNPQFINIESETLISGYTKFWSVINLGSYSGGNFRSQIAMPYQDSITDTDMFIRTATNTAWRAWRRVLHDGNAASILSGSFVTLSTAQTISGIKTFSTNPIVSTRAMVTTAGTAQTQPVATTSIYSDGIGMRGAGNDGGWMRFNEATTNAGELEIATGDDHTEPIYARQYSMAGAVVNAITLMDANGNQTFNTVTATALKKSGGTASQFLMADGSVGDELLYLRSRGITTTNGDDTLWSQIGLKSYHGALPDGLSGVYDYGEAISFACNTARFDMYVNHHSSDGTHNGKGIYYRSGWNTDKRSWQLLLDTINYTSILDTRYVKKAGDTMTGKLTISNSGGGNQLTVNNTAGGESYFWLQSNSINKGALTTMQPSYGTCIYDATSSRYLGIKTNGTPHFQGNTLWHAGNDGSGSGLDADLLDGYHETSFFRNARGSIPTAYIDLTTYASGASDYANYLSGTYSIARRGYSELFVNFAMNVNSTSALQLRTSYTDADALLYRKTIDANRVSGPWRTILTELNIGSYNAGSATKLQTARTLWGQSFDGTANVDGTIHIRPSTSSYTEGLRIHQSTEGNWAAIVLCGKDNTGNSGTSNGTWGIFNNPNYDLFINRGNSSSHTGYEFCNIGGNWGIGTILPQYKLDVNGTLHASDNAAFGADVSVYGNLRLKNSGNYGNAINFGDGEYVYIAELTDDVMTINATGGIVMSTGTNTVSGTFTGNLHGNSSTATTLQTARTINGTSFDGSSNIVTSYWGTSRNFRIQDPSTYSNGPWSSVNGSGDVTIRIPTSINGLVEVNSTDIYASNSVQAFNGIVSRTSSYGGLWIYGGTQYYLARIHAFGSSPGWSENERWLDVNNDRTTRFYHSVRSDGDMTALGNLNSSDMRMKTVLRSVSLRLEDIAAAPLFVHTWKNGHPGEYVGTSAQYWEEVLPQLVKFDTEGMRALAYGNLALAGVISVARRTLSLDDEVKNLRTRVENLEKENKQLRAMLRA